MRRWQREPHMCALELGEQGDRVSVMPEKSKGKELADTASDRGEDVDGEELFPPAGGVL